MSEMKYIPISESTVINEFIKEKISKIQRDIDEISKCIENVVKNVLEVKYKIKCGMFVIEVEGAIQRIEKFGKLIEMIEESFANAVKNEIKTVTYVEIRPNDLRYWVRFKKDGKYYIDILLNIIILDDIIIYDFEPRAVYVIH
ncbi:MAG: hypothetical protein QXS16_05440 [Pyrobaculum sp.]